MTTDSIATKPAVPVMYVQGQPGKPISAQAPVAFQRLEAKLPSLRGRRFFGVVKDGEYRACVATRPDDDAGRLSLATWNIPAGKYARRKIRDWDGNAAIIGPAFEELCARPDFDPSRPMIEHYRSHRELLLKVPIH